MSDKPKYRFAVEHLQLGKVDTQSGVVTLASIGDVVWRNLNINSDTDIEPFQLHFEPLSMTMTKELAASLFNFQWQEPQLIAKIPTKKGDLYAPVKSHDGGKIVLDIPEDEAEMWKQSDYWKEKLESQIAAQVIKTDDLTQGEVDDLANLAVLNALRDETCLYCGKGFAVARDAFGTSTKGHSAHGWCYYEHEADDLWRKEHPEYAMQEGGE